MLKILITFFVSATSYFSTEAQDVTYTPTLFKAVNYTQTQEDSVAATLTGKRFGYFLIFNTTLQLPRIWNGTAFEDAPAVSLTVINKVAGIQFSGEAPGVTAGLVGWDSTGRKLLFTSYLVQRSFDLSHGIVTSDVTDFNSTDEVVLDSIPMAPNFPSEGKVVAMRLFGIYTLQANKFFTLRLRHGSPTGTLLDSCVSQTSNPGVTDKDWQAEFIITFRTIGVSGTMIGHAHLATNGIDVPEAPQGVQTVNTTETNTCYITVQLSDVGNNKVKLQQGWATTRN